MRIEPDRLREEYRWKIIGRLGNSGQQHPDIRIEEIFAEICAENAFREIDPYWLGIETAKVFRTSSLRNDETIISSISVTDIFFDVYLGKWNYRAIPKVKTWSYFLTIPKLEYSLNI